MEMEETSNNKNKANAERMIIEPEHVRPTIEAQKHTTLPDSETSHDKHMTHHHQLLKNVRDRWPRLFKYLQMLVLFVMGLTAVYMLIVHGHLTPNFNALLTGASSNGTASTSLSNGESNSAALQRSFTLLQNLYTVLTLLMGLPIALPASFPQEGRTDHQTLDLINSQLERLFSTVSNCNISSATCF